MYIFSFEAIGTLWHIHIDSQKISNQTKRSIIQICTDFDNHFSRFIPTSEVSRINQNPSSTITISNQLAQYLKFGHQLKTVTNGYFDPAIISTLEAYGYDANYSFKMSTLPSWVGDWHITNRKLTKELSTKICLDAWGKGILIDQIAKYFLSNNLRYFLINGGGDIFATQKSSGQPWHVAIEHPMKSDQAIAHVFLNHQALASSSPRIRRFANFHHLINAKTQKPIHTLLSTHALATTATVADAVATALFVSPQSYWEKIITNFKSEYLVVFPKLIFKKSANFQANLYS